MQFKDFVVACREIIRKGQFSRVKYLNMKKTPLLFIPLLVLLSCSTDQQRQFIFLEGFTQGTSYHIAYSSTDSVDYHDEIKGLFRDVDNSMSIYNHSSVISAINRNDEGIEPDSYFITVFNRALEIYEETGGAFDITVAPLVNAWGFGLSERENVTPELVLELLRFVGSDKVWLEDGFVVKQYPEVMLDMNAIAKGYTVDVVAEFLDGKGVSDYMIEVGGEIRLKGRNRNNGLWRIGVDKPIEDPAVVSRELQAVLELTDKSIATSGNYRRFYIQDGQKFAHTIDPLTGYPVRHNLLSVTVITNTCMDADAWATAFMVMGLEKSIELVEKNPELEAYFIYDLNGIMATAFSSGTGDMISR